MSARSKEFRINFNHEDLLLCEAAGVEPRAFVNDSVRAALADLESNAKSIAEETVEEEVTEEDEEESDE